MDTTERVSWDSPEITALMVDYEAELVGLGVVLNHDWTGGTVAASQFEDPRGAYLACRRDGRIVACGGVRLLTDEVAELKRMYVVPEARRGGLALHLLAVLEDAARSLGAAVARLDTGREMAPALGLYRRAGYREIADYNGNPDAGWWFEKPLR